MKKIIKLIFPIILVIIIISICVFKLYYSESKYQKIYLGSTDEMAVWLLSKDIDLESSEPHNHFEIVIPQNFKGTYSIYADMQENQQLPLSDFKGKTADEYIFSLNENCFAELIISNNILIGAIKYNGNSPLDFEPVIY